MFQVYIIGIRFHLLADTISKFNYMLPYGDVDSDDDEKNGLDDDGDFILKRTRKGFIEIEHKKTTALHMVGLQVWRGALLLADFIITNRKLLAAKKILEVGSGVGLTSIIAAKYCKEVICTGAHYWLMPTEFQSARNTVALLSDIDIGEILQLIQSNIHRNLHLLPSNNVKVMELDFKADTWPPTLWENINDAEIVLAADGNYSRVIS